MLSLSKTSLLALFAASLTAATADPSSGCESKAPFAAKPGGELVELDIDGRLVHVSLPKHYENGPASLIIAFHDQNMTAKEFEEVSLLSQHKANSDSVIVYPQGKDNEWQSDPSADRRINDLAFTTSILDTLTSQLCIDKDRVYALGLGTGAGLAHLAACDPTLAPRFAAYAAVNGAFFAGPDPESSVRSEFEILWGTCQPGAERKPARILAIHGTENKVFDYAGEWEVQGSRRVSVVKWLVDWAIMNGCGRGLALPVPLPGSEGEHLTRLRRGSLVEGQLRDAVIQATYRCWAPMEEESYTLAAALVRQFDNEVLVPYGDVEKEESARTGFALQRLDEVMAAAQAAYEATVKEMQQAREGGAKELTDEQVKELQEYSRKGEDLIKHMIVVGDGHGWPRLQRNGENWEPLSEDSLAEDSVFDATAEVFKWLGDKHLSHTMEQHESKEEDAATIMQGLEKEELEQVVEHIVAAVRLKIMIKEQMEWQAKDLKAKNKRPAKDEL